jgi:serine/threonine-protein kinase
VFAAYDPDLGREVAIKRLHRGADPLERERLRREARAAAGISHPGVCQLYEIGEADEELFIAMELVDGAPLASRLAGGPIPPRDAATIATAVLWALDAVHARGIVHRDLKPSNVIVTAQGVKLVDFGLARTGGSAIDVTAAVTQPGAVLGTPRYMAPEQIEGRTVDARTDLFAVGCILFEMLAGRPAFAGNTIPETVHAIMYEQPAVLTGSPAVAALDRIIHRALAKARSDRYETARAMLADLEALQSADWSSQTIPVVRTMTRLIVAPFRLLRADPDVDFLAFGLADAIATSLAGLQSLIVRSTAAAGVDTGGPPDLKRIVESADVDVVLLGTILRAGDQLRVVCQLVEAPGGTVAWSHTAQVAMGDIFQLQDDLTHRIVDSLSVPLSAREQRLLRHDVPATARAYEFYLRANQLAQHVESWIVARDVYRQCLAEDPRYAPAWARLGRVCRVLAKYAAAEPHAAEWQREAQDALQRALELNPDLPLAHYLTAQVDVDRGHAERAMVRLLERLSHAADSQLFAGLVQACRYCGLLDISLEAHEQARRLDKGQVTTVVHTLWSLGAHERAFEEALNETLGYMHPVILVALGRHDEALSHLLHVEAKASHPALSTWYASLRGALSASYDEAAMACERIVALNVPDPESLYHMARTLAYCKRSSRALDLFSRTVDEGYFNVALFERDPWVDTLRGHAQFTAALDRARVRRRQAREAFERAGGHLLFAARPVS